MHDPACQREEKRRLTRKPMRERGGTSPRPPRQTATDPGHHGPDPEGGSAAKSAPAQTRNGGRLHRRRGE